MNKSVLIGIAIALAGVYLLGAGITGFVVSQTCCFPPDCETENQCSILGVELENTKSSSWPFLTLGGFLFLLTAFLIILKKRH